MPTDLRRLWNSIFRVTCYLVVFLYCGEFIVRFATFCDSHFFSLIIVRKRVNTDRYEKYFNVFGWGVPIILSVSPLIARRYGPKTVWYVYKIIFEVTPMGRCWITTEYDGVWEFVCLYLEMILLTVIALYLWSHVIFSAIQVRRIFCENSYWERYQVW
jgi:hypothetical protein